MNTDDSMVLGVWAALRDAFAPLWVMREPPAEGSPHRVRFEISGPGWTHHHAIYLTRDGRLTYAIERELQLDDPTCFEKVASEMKANLNAM